MSDVKIIIEIALLLIGSGLGVGYWQRFTYKKQYDAIKADLEKLKIEYSDIKRKLTDYQNKSDRINEVLDFNEHEFEENPDMALKFLKYINKKRINEG